MRLRVPVCVCTAAQGHVAATKQIKQAAPAAHKWHCFNTAADQCDHRVWVGACLVGVCAAVCGARGCPHVVSDEGSGCCDYTAAV